jgi:hypothetical protein
LASHVLILNSVIVFLDKDDAFESVATGLVSDSCCRTAAAATPLSAVISWEATGIDTNTSTAQQGRAAITTLDNAYVVADSR